MLPPDPASSKVSLMFIEGGLTLIAAAVAFAWPTIGAGWFSRIERGLGALARRQGLAVAVVGMTAFVLRLAILPFCPVPHPFIPDDFSFLLAANTFASGRLTNPTPAMWPHFESIHVSMTPTYVSMYFPAQGLLLAASKVVTGHPWHGVVVMSALMCAAICWMLQAWLPPGWALLGGVLALLRLGLFSYWINTYTGGGLIAAFGGALVLGALPRLLRRPRLRYPMLMAGGVVLLAMTRPYEGILLCLPVGFSLGHWLWAGKNRPGPAKLLRLAAAPLALTLAGLAWLGYYDYRAFGSPLTLPYTVNRNTYAMAPYFVWQPARPEPVYRHASLRRFYYENELSEYQRVHNSFLYRTLLKTINGALFFIGFALLPPIIMFRRVLLDRRTRFLVWCVAVMAAGMLIQIFFIAHYVAPFTAAFYALGLQAMRHLRVAKFAGRPVGLAIVRLTVTICIALAGMRVFAGPLHFSTPEWPASQWSTNWYGPSVYGEERARIESQLEQLPGKQLAIVRYSGDHYPLDEWVYNGVDIDGAKVIWAREMDAADDVALIRRYQDRSVWLVQPDMQPAAISPYPMPGDQVSMLRSK